jgi:hypothetical protein
MGRRYGYGPSPVSDPSLRASDAERNDVADRLSRHFAEGRLDQTEFKTRLDTAMSATTRGDLHGLFHDLPPLAVQEPTTPLPKRRRFVPLWAMLAILIVAVSVTASTWPFVHVPWFLVFVAAFFFWHRSGRWHSHRHHELEH